MKNILFMMISSFLPVALLNLFAEGNSAMAQPQMGQPQMGQAQRGASSSQVLGSYSLPAGPIKEGDIPSIKGCIQQVLDKTSEAGKSAGKRVDYQAIRSGILTFQDWLKKQGCISAASTSYDIENSENYTENIFITYPGQLPFDIVFNMEGGIKKPYRLLIFVTTVDLFKFASLVENKSIAGVPFPKSWPKDTWSYWEPRL